jgi:hypothetical protein
MRTLFLLSLFVTVAVGCQEKKSDTQQPPVVPDNGAVIAPPGEVAGSIRGKPFKPDKIQFEGRRLSFRSGKDFFADMEMWFELPLAGDAKLEGKDFTYGGDQFGHPSILVSAKEGKDFPKSDFVWPKDYKLTLHITRHTNKALEGTIDLRITSPPNTHLAGNFTAEVTKSATDALDADDAPYVQGKIAIAGAFKDVSLGAGFVGKATDGKQVSNMVGTRFSSGGGESATSTSFKPQLTSLFNHPKNGLHYKHVKMAPGEHILYVRRDDVPAAWKKVSVKPGDELTVDLTIDPAQMGSLVVTLPDEEVNDKNEWHLALVPFEFDAADFSIQYAFKAADVKAGNKTVTVKGVPAGKYRAVRGKSEATVEVTAGKEATVTLVRAGAK